MGLLDNIKPQAKIVRPAELAFAVDGALRIRWEDGQDTSFGARFLRANCPCAGCVEEWTGRRTVSEAQLPEGIQPRGMTPVGRYAVQIDWSDGHSTGIYSWDYLLKLRDSQSITGAT
jgi:DUF971 family protein